MINNLKFWTANLQRFDAKHVLSLLSLLPLLPSIQVYSSPVSSGEWGLNSKQAVNQWLMRSLGRMIILEST